MKKKWHLYEVNNKLSFEHENLRLENQPSTGAHLRRKIHKVCLYVWEHVPLLYNSRLVRLQHWESHLKTATVTSQSEGPAENFVHVSSGS